MPSVVPRAGGRGREPVIVSGSPAMLQVCAVAERVAGGDAKVFISGESGVGKDLIAQYIHARSRRSARPFIAVNCAAFSETLLESELFGHARGSFTGAYRDRAGCLEQAHLGTIFLDEVGEMSLRMQADLLRFLQDGEVQRVGDPGARRHVDVRVIAATNRDLAERVTSGHFRKDLLYRIQVVQLHIPPLRERREDIRALIVHAVARTGRPITLLPEAIRALERYSWPGNVRELQNVIEQVAWTAGSDAVSLRDLPENVRMAPHGGVLPRRERRRQAADDLYTALVGQHYTFWKHIHSMFLRRDMTRHDLRQLTFRSRSARSLEPGARGEDRGADRSEDIQSLYDAIVLTDPFYQVAPLQSTPAALAALRDSKSLLVPDLARRDYERAQEAFRAGDYDRASSLGVRVTRMLDELEVGAAPAGLQEAVRQLVVRIDGARAHEAQRIYTTADAGVIPPAAIGRQLPLTAPMGLSNQHIGTLEMLISQAGQVEAVKLHTPLNRYHERMIVSAAKAWRYRPALKQGKPVRFRLISSINLPES